MKTIDIEIALMKHFNIRKNLIIPTVTKLSGLVKFETDLLILSKSGYATGIEIKVSKADLLNDLKKPHIKNYNKSRWGKEHYFGEFKYFYYAVPPELIDNALEVIYEDFGLISFKGNKAVVIRKSKHLFNNHWDDSKQYKLARLGALRILKYKEKIKLWKMKNT